MIVKIGIFPKFRGMGSFDQIGVKIKKYLKPPPPRLFFLQDFLWPAQAVFPPPPGFCSLALMMHCSWHGRRWIRSPDGHWNRKKALPHDNDKLQMTNVFLGTAFFTSHYFNHDPCQSSCFQFLSFVVFFGFRFFIWQPLGAFWGHKLVVFLQCLQNTPNLHPIGANFTAHHLQFANGTMHQAFFNTPLLTLQKSVIVEDTGTYYKIHGTGIFTHMSSWFSWM